MVEGLDYYDQGPATKVEHRRTCSSVGAKRKGWTDGWMVDGQN